MGLTIETVSRTLTDLRKWGVIAAPNAHVVRILDEEALQEIAST